MGAAPLLLLPGLRWGRVERGRAQKVASWASPTTTNEANPILASCSRLCQALRRCRARDRRPAPLARAQSWRPTSEPTILPTNRVDREALTRQVGHTAMPPPRLAIGSLYFAATDLVEALYRGPADTSVGRNALAKQNASSPPGRSSRATPGTQRYLSAQDMTQSREHRMLAVCDQLRYQFIVPHGGGPRVPSASARTA